MRCPRCGRDTGAFDRCDACGATLAASTAAETASGVFSPRPDDALTHLPTETPVAPDETPLSPGPLVSGQSFGPRYRITRLLGMGGMGAVYQAQDAELGVSVAIKVIRPEATADSTTAAVVEQRFKRELLLAREVTHKNVVRIHDLGEIGGIKYITMSYVDGENLSAILRRRGKLPVGEALGVARQIASGLQAAYEAGVVHRDLKPANVMIDRSGHAIIMDFGIARLESTTRPGEATVLGMHGQKPSADGLTGGTLAGAVVGTVDYMAPEQAKGGQVDHRADIYAFGLILHDMLVGLRPLRDPLEDLRKRIEEGLPPLRSVDATLPETLERVVSRCLQVDPGARYQTAAELCSELARLDEDGKALPEPRRLTWRVAVAGILIVGALVAGTVWLVRPSPPPPQHEPVSVLVADFDNRTNDPVFSGAVEQALAVGLEGASFVSVYPQKDARSLLTQIGYASGGRITVEAAQLVARREGIKVLVVGTIEGAQRGYRIATRLLDPADAKVVASAERWSADKGDVLKAVGELAGEARLALGETRSEMGKAETFTAASLGAVREYTIAGQLQDNYKDDEAAKHYEQATREDPGFGRAYAGWAYSALRLGRKDQSAELWKKALSLIERMTEREKYRTLGVYYGTITRDYEKAIENYTTLVKLFPADDAGHNNLALAYFNVRNFDKALEQGRMALQLYPRQPLYRGNAALYAMYAGDFASAAAEAGRLVKEKPDYYPAYLPLAVAALGDGKLDAAREFYRQMATTGASGASVAAAGLADVALYEGRDTEAVRILEAGIAEDAKAQNQIAAATKYVALAEAYLGLGRRADAERASREALKISRSEEVSYPSARILIATGSARDAEVLARELGGQLEPQRRAYGKLIEAELALSRREFVEALEALRSAQKLADVWLGRFALGRLDVEANRDAEAVSELELARKRRGEATAVFLDDLPTFRYLATLPYWLGRAQEGLGLLPVAQANYKAFLAPRSAAVKDPLLIDARRRLGQR